MVCVCVSWRDARESGRHNPRFKTGPHVTPLNKIVRKVYTRVFMMKGPNLKRIFCFIHYTILSESQLKDFSLLAMFSLRK